jgi:undecaprenyl-diphosphatase
VNSLIESIVVGLFQGILEWLPVSSEGNLLIILSILFGLKPEEAFNTAIFLHIGTGLAALVYFRAEVFKIVRARTKRYSDLRIKLLTITTITGVIGFPIFMWLNVSIVYGEFLLTLTGLALIITGLLQREAAKQEQDGSNLSWSLSIILGVAQGLAIIPGLSRSGLTTSIMLIKNFSGENAFQISFLMSIPVSFAAAFGLMIVEGLTPDPFLAFATLTAAVTGYLVIDKLIEISRRISFWKICVILGVLAVITWLPTFLF